jgi:hypothetical protein
MAKAHTWGASSARCLATCTPDTQRFARRVLDLVPFDLRILVGHRGRAEQQAALASGNSNAAYGQSPHNRSPSWAFDLAPILDSDGDGDVELAFKEASGREVAANGGGPVSEAFRQIGAAVAQASRELGIPATWGGDWDKDGDRAEHRLYDPGHIEIDGWRAVGAAP